MNMWIYQHFHDFSKTFMIWVFFQDFSRPGNDHFKIPWLFQVFHDRMNPGRDFRPTVAAEQLWANGAAGREKIFWEIFLKNNMCGKMSFKGEECKQPTTTKEGHSSVETERWCGKGTRRIASYSKTPFLLLLLLLLLASHTRCRPTASCITGISLNTV